MSFQVKVYNKDHERSVECSKRVGDDSQLLTLKLNLSSICITLTVFAAQLAVANILNQADSNI